MGIVKDITPNIVNSISIASKLPKNEIQEKLEVPADPKNGDLALPCFYFVKEAHENPVDMANKIAIRVEKDDNIKMVRAAGPYVNFYFNWEKIGKEILTEIFKKGRNYGKGPSESRAVLIEHTSANPDGPLHIGHFRNSVIGDSLARIMKFSGHPVKTDFYVNDSGRQISIAVREYLHSKPHPKVLKKPDWWVVDIYTKGSKTVKRSKKADKEVREIIKKYEAGDKELVEAFKFIVNSCLKGHKETLERLGIKIDNFQHESKYLFSRDVKRILSSLKKRKIAKSKGKRLWVDLKKFGIKREFTLTREDGTSIYPARDLAYHKDKFSRGFRNINVIGTDQKFYFQQLTSTLSLLYPRETGRYNIVFYEHLLLPGGSMSTREGKFVALDSLLDRAIKEANKVTKKKLAESNESKIGKKEAEEIARKIGIGALKYAMIKVSPEKTYAFNIKDTLSFDGNTAPYLMYSHARAASIIKKAGAKTMTTDFSDDWLKEDKEKALLKLLAVFPEIVSKASRDLRPHYISNYAYSLASTFNEFYQAVPVLKADNDMRESRLALVSATKTVLSSALDLLGIEALERM